MITAATVRDFFTKRGKKQTQSGLLDEDKRHEEESKTFKEVPV